MLVAGEQSAMTYEKFSANEPSNEGGVHEGCIEARGGGEWNDEPCGERVPVVCAWRESKFFVRFDLSRHHISPTVVCTRAKCVPVFSSCC